MSTKQPSGDPHGQDDWGDDENLCDVCGGDGYIMAADGDGSDWGEDTYADPMDAMIKCRHCSGGRK